MDEREKRFNDFQNWVEDFDLTVTQSLVLEWAKLDKLSETETAELLEDCCDTWYMSPEDTILEKEVTT